MSARRLPRYTIRLSASASHNLPARDFHRYLAAGLIIADTLQQRVASLARGVIARTVAGKLTLLPPVGASIASNWRAVERAFLIANAGQYQMPIGFSEQLIREKYADNPERAKAEIEFYKQHQREWDIQIFHCDR